MTLNTKLAFEIWAGVVVLIVVIAFVAGGTLWFGNDVTPLLVKTQVNTAPSSSKGFSSSAIQNASLGISDALKGGAQP